MDEDVDVIAVVVMEGIFDTIKLMVVIIQIPRKRKTSWNHQKWNNTKVKQENWKCIQNTPSKAHENNCHICGMKGHWSRTCRTPKHLVALYQALIKEKRKYIEINFTDINRLYLTYYDTDFFGGHSEKTDDLMNDEKMLLHDASYIKIK